MATAPPMIDLIGYHRAKVDNKGASVEDIANELGISVEEAQQFETNLAQIISDVKQEIQQQQEIDQANRHANFLNIGGKSRRHAKKSRRHAKKSRRHAKKSRR
jgi:hypothetical protein